MVRPNKPSKPRTRSSYKRKDSPPPKCPTIQCGLNPYKSKPIRHRGPNPAPRMEAHREFLLDEVEVRREKGEHYSDSSEDELPPPPKRTRLDGRRARFMDDDDDEEEEEPPQSSRASGRRSRRRRVSTSPESAQDDEDPDAAGPSSRLRPRVDRGSPPQQHHDVRPRVRSSDEVQQSSSKDSQNLDWCRNRDPTKDQRPFCRAAYPGAIVQPLPRVVGSESNNEENTEGGAITRGRYSKAADFKSNDGSDSDEEEDEDDDYEEEDDDEEEEDGVEGENDDDAIENDDADEQAKTSSDDDEKLSSGGNKEAACKDALRKRQETLTSNANARAKEIREQLRHRRTAKHQHRRTILDSESESESETNDSPHSTGREAVLRVAEERQGRRGQDSPDFAYATGRAALLGFVEEFQAGRGQDSPTTSYTAAKKPRSPVEESLSAESDKHESSSDSDIITVKFQSSAPAADVDDGIVFLGMTTSRCASTVEQHDDETHRHDRPRAQSAPPVERASIVHRQPAVNVDKLSPSNVQGFRAPPNEELLHVELPLAFRAHQPVTDGGNVQAQSADHSPVDAKANAPDSSSSTLGGGVTSNALVVTSTVAKTEDEKKGASTSRFAVALHEADGDKGRVAVDDSAEDEIRTLEEWVSIFGEPTKVKEDDATGTAIAGTSGTLVKAEDDKEESSFCQPAVVIGADDGEAAADHIKTPEECDLTFQESSEDLTPDEWALFFPDDETD